MRQQRLIKVRIFELAAVSLGFAMALASCTSTTESHPPDILRLLGGDAQTGIAGKALPAPLQLVLTSSDGTPRAGAQVTWTVTNGGGSVSPSHQVTDSQGMASATWILGQEPGPQSV